MPISKKGKSYFTKEQRARAEAYSALAYAEEHGYDLVKDGGFYRLREHSSMVFTADGRWYWNSRGKHGRALAMLTGYEELSLVDAVLLLAGESAGSSASRKPPPGKGSLKMLIPPARASTTRQLYAYLCKTRGLDRDIVHSLVHAGRIYQAEYVKDGRVVYNAAFVGFGPGGKDRPMSIFLRGLTDQSAFKMEVAGSDKCWPFILPGAAGCEAAAFFEGAIDAISHATAARLDGSDDSRMDRVALGGSFPMEAVTNYLDRHPEKKEIIIGFDNDEAGRTLFRYLVRGLEERGYLPRLQVKAQWPPAGAHDWNDYLRERKGGVITSVKYAQLLKSELV